MDVIAGAKGGQSPLARFVDLHEQYGETVIGRFARLITPRNVVDLGVGQGRDLDIIRMAHPGIHTTALDCSRDYLDGLGNRFDCTEALNLETEPLPFDDASVDLIVANQVLEHVKEIFWIWHEVSRSLAVGGHFLIGVPNILSFHNRMLGLIGQHPTQWKSYSAHVRPFSKPDTVKFTQVCWPGGYELVAFAGSQFYPFPKIISRALCRVFPAAAVTVFFLFRKTKSYDSAFVRHPVRARLETNFYLGS